MHHVETGLTSLVISRCVGVRTNVSCLGRARVREHSTCSKSLPSEKAPEPRKGNRHTPYATHAAESALLQLEGGSWKVEGGKNEAAI